MNPNWLMKCWPCCSIVAVAAYVSCVMVGVDDNRYHANFDCNRWEIVDMLLPHSCVHHYHNDCKMSIKTFVPLWNARQNVKAHSIYEIHYQCHTIPSLNWDWCSLEIVYLVRHSNIYVHVSKQDQCRQLSFDTNSIIEHLSNNLCIDVFVLINMFHFNFINFLWCCDSFPPIEIDTVHFWFKFAESMKLLGKPNLIKKQDLKATHIYCLFYWKTSAAVLLIISWRLEYICTNVSWLRKLSAWDPLCMNKL